MVAEHIFSKDSDKDKILIKKINLKIFFIRIFLFKFEYRNN